MSRLRIFLLATSLMLTACGGGGAASSVGATPPVATLPPVSTVPPVVANNVLFVADPGNKVIAAFDVLAPTPGTTSMTGKLLTSDTGIGYSPQFDTQRNLLYTAYADHMNVYASARTLTGRVSPARTITASIAGGAFLQRLVLDVANDRLYVGYTQGAFSSVGFAVFDKVSTMGGQVAPSRLFKGPIDTHHFALDTKRAIPYSKFSHFVYQDVYVFVGVDTAVGEQPIARRIPSEGRAYVGLAVDQERDRLYAGTNSGGLVVFSEASRSNKNIGCGAILPGWRFGGVMALDSKSDRLYAGLDGTALVVNAASTIGQPGWAAPQAFTASAGAQIEGFAF